MLRSGRPSDALVELETMFGVESRGDDCYHLAVNIPYQIPSQNAREAVHGLKRKAHMDRLLKMCKSVIPQQTPVPEVRACVIHANRRRLIRDEANLVGGAKALVDCLVLCGVLWDDSIDFARISYGQSQIVSSSEPSTTVTVWAIDESLWTERQRRAVATAPKEQPAVSHRRACQLAAAKRRARR
jgi:hypothetical protein